MTTVLLIVIAVSLLVILVGLIVVGVTAYRLYKHVRRIQDEVEPQVQVLMAKQATAMEMMARIEEKQSKLGDGMQRASASVSKLTYLASEYKDATNRLKGY
ncbi:MAG: hypothetical protein ACYCX3_06435 [Thermoleophilia bacterium]